MNVLAPFGFYGWGNIGDEATLQGFARLIARAGRPFKVWAGSHDPRHTAHVEPSFRYFHADNGGLNRRWANYRTSAVVVAGGTPIMDTHGSWPLSELVPLVTEAERRKKPIVFVGSGTERLQREDSRRIFQQCIAPFVRFWTVRSEPDRARLIEYGVQPQRVRVAGDMAWLLEPARPDWGREQLRSWGVPLQEPLIGVNLLTQRPVSERYPDILEKMAEFLDRLIETRGVRVLFFANDVKETSGFDRPAALQTLSAMRHRHRTFLVPNSYWPPQRVMSLIANCHATISMRYHFCLFSALQGVPFIALQRSDKVSDICSDLNWPFGTQLDGLKGHDLDALYEGLEADRPAVMHGLRDRVPQLRERAHGNSAALEVLNN